MTVEQAILFLGEISAAPPADQGSWEEALKKVPAECWFAGILVLALAFRFRWQIGELRERAIDFAKPDSPVINVPQGFVGVRVVNEVVDRDKTIQPKSLALKIPFNRFDRMVLVDTRPFEIRVPGFSRTFVESTSFGQVEFVSNATPRLQVLSPEDFIEYYEGSRWPVWDFKNYKNRGGDDLAHVKELLEIKWNGIVDSEFLAAGGRIGRVDFLKMVKDGGLDEGVEKKLVAILRLETVRAIQESLDKFGFAAKAPEIMKELGYSKNSSKLSTAEWIKRRLTIKRGIGVIDVSLEGFDMSADAKKVFGRLATLDAQKKEIEGERVASGEFYPDFLAARAAGQNPNAVVIMGGSGAGKPDLSAAVLGRIKNLPKDNGAGNGRTSMKEEIEDFDEEAEGMDEEIGGEENG